MPSAGACGTSTSLLGLGLLMLLCFCSAMASSFFSLSSAGSRTRGFLDAFGQKSCTAISASRRKRISRKTFEWHYWTWDTRFLHGGGRQDPELPELVHHVLPIITRQPCGTVRQNVAGKKRSLPGNHFVNTEAEHERRSSGTRQRKWLGRPFFLLS